MFPRVPVSQRHSRVTVRVNLRSGNRSDQKKKNVRSRNEGHYRGTRVVYNIYTCLYMYIDIRVCSNARAQRTSSFLSASFENWHDTPRTSLQRATRPNIDRRKNIAKKGGAISQPWLLRSFSLSSESPRLSFFTFIRNVLRVNDTRHNLIPPDEIPDRSENWYYASDSLFPFFGGATISIKKV